MRTRCVCKNTGRICPWWGSKTWKCKQPSRARVPSSMRIGKWKPDEDQEMKTRWGSRNEARGVECCSWKCERHVTSSIVTFVEGCKQYAHDVENNTVCITNEKVRRRSGVSIISVVSACWWTCQRRTQIWFVSYRSETLRNLIFQQQAIPDGGHENAGEGPITIAKANKTRS